MHKAPSSLARSIHESPHCHHIYILLFSSLLFLSLSLSHSLSSSQKKVVEQLRKELLVKQDQAEIRMQAQHPPQPDGKASALPSAQFQPALPPHIDMVPVSS